MNGLAAVPFVKRTRRLLVPEVVQTSSMDCGPAALKSLLEGFRISVNYERLRDACHTEIDGTSIDTVETLASEFGLGAEQIILPADHVLSEHASVLPAVAVVDSPMGGAHFIVVWRRLGRSVQVMDPASGRQWRSTDSLVDSLYVHTAIVSAAEWRGWAGTPDFLNPLGGRLKAIGVARQERGRLLSVALEDHSWHGLATLDAATRVVTMLRRRDSLNSRDGVAMLNALLAEGQSPEGSAIPESFWFARQARSDASGGERLSLRGAVLVRVSNATTSAQSASQEKETEPLSPALAATLREPSVRPIKQVLRLIKSDGLLGTSVWAMALAIAVASVLFEAALLRGLLDASLYLRTVEQGLAAGAILVVFAILLLLLEFGLSTAEKRVGRQLETRLRVAFLSKIPLLGEAFFHTRPISDMAERGHSLHILRDLPALGVRTLRLGLELAVTAAAIAWLAPTAAVLALCAATLAAGIPLLGHSMLAERDLRMRTHAGALSRFQLDALLGRTAIEAHGARPTLEREHEHLLREWIRSSLALHRGSVTLEGVQMLVGFGLVGWIVFSHVGTGSPGATLLLAYWVLNLPALGFELSLYAREYPAYRNVLLRLLEPLNTPDAAPIAEALASRTSERVSKPVRIDAVGVGVQLSGHDVLGDVMLHVEPGSHVAIVGPSGAGKSTLLSLVLGWQQPTTGTLLVDGAPLTPGTAETLRRETACVDPTIQLWNRSLLENLQYGSNERNPIAPVLEAAGLMPVIAKLPDGLGTALGEGGALLSAGEAQRVRLARAMLMTSPRLVILDEPFMGLERDRRRALLAEIRQRWAACTVLYVTHEISEARSFDRVLVMDRGRLVEDGDPRLLMLMASSRYRRLLQAQESVHARLYSSVEWRRVRLEDGRVVQDSSSANIEQTA